MKLITTKKINITLPKGILSEYLYAELINPEMTSNFNFLKFKVHYYYVTKEEIVNPEGETETYSKKNTIFLLDEKKNIEKEINPLFNAFGGDILNSENFKQGLIKNTSLIFEGVIKNGSYFDLSPSDWEVKA